jgi:hypothetical protein
VSERPLSREAERGKAKAKEKTTGQAGATAPAGEQLTSPLPTMEESQMHTDVRRTDGGAYGDYFIVAFVGVDNVELTLGVQRRDTSHLSRVEIRDILCFYVNTWETKYRSICICDNPKTRKEFLRIEHNCECIGSIRNFVDFYHRESSHGSTIIERHRNFMANLVGVVVETFMLGLGRPSRKVFQGELAEILTLVDTSITMCRQGLDDSIKWLKRRGVESHQLALHDYRAKPANPTRSDYALRSISRVLGGWTQDQVSESLAKCSVVCGKHPHLEFKTIEPQFEEVRARYCKRWEEKYSRGFVPIVVTLDEFSYTSKANALVSQGSGGGIEYCRRILMTRPDCLIHLRIEEVMNLIEGPTWPFGETYYLPECDCVIDVNGETKVDENCCHRQLFRFCGRAALSSNFHKTSLITAFRSRIDSASYLLWLTIFPEREGGAARTITEGSPELAFLSSPNSTIGINFLRQLPKIREGVVGFRTGQLTEKLTRLVENALDYAYMVTLGIDCRTATDMFYTECSGRIMGDIHRFNRTKENSPWLGEIVVDACKIECDSRKCFVRRKASQFLSPEQWLKQQDLATFSDFEYLYSEMFQSAIEKPKLYGSLSQMATGTPLTHNKHGSKLATALEASITSRAAWEGAQRRFGLGYRESIHYEPSALIWPNIIGSSKEQLIFNEYLKHRDDSEKLLLEEALFVGDSVTGIPMASPIASTVMGVARNSSLDDAEDMAAKQGEEYEGFGAGDDGAITILTNSAPEVSSSDNVADVIRKFPVLNTCVETQMAFGLVLNLIKTTVSIGSFIKGDTVGQILCERIFLFLLGEREVELAPAPKSRALIGDIRERGTDTSWHDPTGAYSTLHDSSCSVELIEKTFLFVHDEELRIFYDMGYPLHLPHERCGIGLRGIPVRETAILRKIWTMFMSPKDYSSQIKDLRSVFKARGSSFSRSYLRKLYGWLEKDSELPTPVLFTKTTHRAGRTLSYWQEKLITKVEGDLILWLQPSASNPRAPDPLVAASQIDFILRDINETDKEPSNFYAGEQLFLSTGNLRRLLCGRNKLPHTVEVILAAQQASTQDEGVSPDLDEGLMRMLDDMIKNVRGTTAGLVGGVLRNLAAGLPANAEYHHFGSDSE